MHQIAKEASKAWKDMPSNDKQYWQTISNKDKEDYEKKMSEFEGPMQVRTDKVKKKVCKSMLLCSSICKSRLTMQLCYVL